MESMVRPQDLPDQFTELYDLSKEYLLQETVEPAKALGRQAGLGLGGAAVMALGAFLLAWGLYFGLVTAFPAGEWWRVLAKVVTAVAAVIVAALIAWRTSPPTMKDSI